MVPFITDGLEAGEPVMVAVSALHTKWLRDALDGQAEVEFVDMEELGSALTPLQALRFLIPPSEPDVRVSTHPALHEPVSLGYAAAPDDLVGQGVGMFAAR
jgi:hypothetical protein